MQTLREILTALAASLVLAATVTAFSGCEQKEKVLDVETPGGELEVERNKETGETDVEVTDE